MNPYRDSLKLSEILESRGYVMFKTISNFVRSLYNWWSWENLFFISISTILLTLLVYCGYCIYGLTFLPRTVNGCYVKSHTVCGDSSIVRDVEWQEDYTIAVCSCVSPEGKQACINQALQSDQCKPSGK